jgi:hypothetical protein
MRAPGSGTAFETQTEGKAPQLGVNPLQHLLAASGVLSSLPAVAQQTITGREFFPHLISGSFYQGLVVVFAVAAALSALAAFASLLRGGRYIDDGDENRDL